MEDKDLQEQLNELQTKHESLIREYCKLMDENRKLKGEQNANQTSEYNSLVREYCKLQEENKKLKENFTYLKGQGYLSMNETTDDLKIQIKILCIIALISLCGIIGGVYIFDATSYTTTGIVLALLCFWFFCCMCQISKQDC